MGNVKIDLKRRKPIPCKNCRQDVWHINMGVCEECFTAAYRVFINAMGWE
jgi:hypothetical protein